MTENIQEAKTHNTHGAIVKLFGVILIILGTLNTMLSWRGGFAVMSLPVILLALGLGLCLVGSVMKNRLGRA